MEQLLNDDAFGSNALCNPNMLLYLSDDDDGGIVFQNPSSQLPQQQQQQLPQQQQQQQRRVSDASSGQPTQTPTADHGMSADPSGTATHQIERVSSASPQQTLYAGSAAAHQATANVYVRAAEPPLCATALDFRKFRGQKKVPPYVEAEETTGIFVGQLPSSYSEDDIEALLKAIGNERGQLVQVRDIKLHNRDRTCAFIMINAGAIISLLGFSKRVLCDVNCVWVVESAKASQLSIFVQQMPREQLRGVPKAALVLEKLTPQGKARHSGSCASSLGLPQHQQQQQSAVLPPPLPQEEPLQQHPIQLRQQQQQQQRQRLQGESLLSGVPIFPYGAQVISPLSSSGGGLSAVPQQLFVSTGMGGYVDIGTGYQPGILSSAGLPFAFSQLPGPLYNPTSATSSTAGVLPPMYSVAASQGFIASGRTTATQSAILSATRSRQNSLNQGTLTPPTTPPVGTNMPAACGPKLPTAVSLPQTLQKARCSCGQLLYLSQFPQMGQCNSCQADIEASCVAYWCPAGHLAVCSKCAVRSNNFTTAADAAPSCTDAHSAMQPILGSETERRSPASIA